MTSGKNLRWLEKKMSALYSFDGSLLKYVSPSGGKEKIATKLGEANPSGILKLDSNENFFISHSYHNNILADILKDVDLRLYDPTAIAEIKEALGKYVGTPSECITVSSGSEQLIDLIARLFLEKRDNTLSIVPTFFMYEKRVKLEGAELHTVPLDADLSLNVKAILEKVTPKTRLIFVCSPNNPTGNQFELEKIETLADECSALVVIDEAYAEFGDYSAAPLAIKKKNVIVVRTFSKAFGLAGMRFGYSIAPSNIASVLSAIIPYTLSTVTAKYVLKLLSNTHFVEDSIEMAKVERKRLIDELKNIKGLEVFDSKGNFVTFRSYKYAGYIHQQLLERGIMIKNLGSLPVIGHCLRVTVGLPDMNNQFLCALRQIQE